MSADNGIYVLQTVRNRIKDGYSLGEFKKHYVYRVAHAQAIDNFYWYEENQIYNLGWYMNLIWGNSKVFLNKEEALLYAHDFANNLYTEYGVCMIETEYVFPEDC